jgi:hypothetical protein
MYTNEGDESSSETGSKLGSRSDASGSVRGALGFVLAGDAESRGRVSWFETGSSSCLLVVEP